MNLNDIKGIVEIDGLKFDPKDILRALVEQGLKVHSLNGTLLIGRSFIDQSPDLKFGEEACSMSPYCKIYDRMNSGASCKQDLSSSTLQTQLDSFNQFPKNFQPDSNKTYVERVEIDNDDINITDLFGTSSAQPPTYKPLPFNDIPSSNHDDLDKMQNYFSEPTEMMGMSQLNKYGTYKMDIYSIPRKERGKCTNCGITVNVNWKFCGKCGNTM